MPTTTKNRRRHSRHSISPATLARVELCYPSPHGRVYEMPLTNLSASGLSFRLDEGSEGMRLEEGSTVEGVVVRVGECRMDGELLVMHVTTDPDSRYVCGALFYPATDTDLIKLKSVIAGMEVAGTE